ncbi:FadR/GntR family transcriptional regulator [Lignipirellula cremea]|uniref:HTH-type transcriptional regulator LutR n=1 Tax=Lignipirellula cremea TaxID=2528010 RepID=A0A518DZM7_9BACT|nr:FadR/GntR family transcriptional regulator [Lignipirellula cremea]QDU97298.1 HTH-type transcriptional regulator LutR [Lignipirellula cremea]
MSKIGELPVLQTTKLVEQTVVCLRDRILQGDYLAGDLLPSQGALCEELGVSRSVIREAMRTLQSLGLLDVSQGRRPSVRPAEPSAVIETLGMLVARSDLSMTDLIEVRRPLEVEIAGLAALRRTDPQLQKMEIAIRDQRAARDVAQQAACDLRFHQVLVEASGNALFGIVLNVLAEMLRRSRRQTLQHSGVEVALFHHQRILDAVAASDEQQARQAMAAHILQTLDDLKAGNP